MFSCSMCVCCCISFFPRHLFPYFFKTPLGISFNNNKKSIHVFLGTSVSCALLDCHLTVPPLLPFSSSFISPHSTLRPFVWSLLLPTHRLSSLWRGPPSPFLPHELCESIFLLSPFSIERITSFFKKRDKDTGRDLLSYDRKDEKREKNSWGFDASLPFPVCSLFLSLQLFLSHSLSLSLYLSLTLSLPPLSLSLFLFLLSLTL